MDKAKVAGYNLMILVSLQAQQILDYRPNLKIKNQTWSFKHYWITQKGI